ncbi:MAG: YbjN domain-containing protein [Thermotogae bacterium]|nr:YbjN domain-containing protein [Thermotogota bacterium]
MKVRIVPGINEDLIRETEEKVRSYLREIVGDFVELEGIFSFEYGSVRINVEVRPWHREDVLVRVFSYLNEGSTIDCDLATILLDLNARLPLGAFALGTDNSILFQYSLAGANLDLNELAAAVHTVATVSDTYDEMVKLYSGGEGID